MLSMVVINYFDWGIFNSYVNVYQRVTMVCGQCKYMQYIYTYQYNYSRHAGSLIVHDMDQYGYCYIVKWQYHDI